MPTPIDDLFRFILRSCLVPLALFSVPFRPLAHARSAHDFQPINQNETLDPFFVNSCFKFNIGVTVDVPEFDGHKNVKFLKIEGTQVRFSHNDGISLAFLNTIPEELRKKILKTLPRVDVAGQKRILDAQQWKEDEEKAVAEFKKRFGGTVYGEILQVTESGLLVTRSIMILNSKKPAIETRTVREEILGSSNMGRRPQFTEKDIKELKYEDDVELFGDEVLFVKCDTKGLFEKKHIKIAVFPAGTHTYRSVGAGSVTVRAFTTDLDEAIKAYDPFKPDK